MPIGNGTQVRTLTVATDGGSLAASTVILRASARYPGIAAVTAGPGGTLRIMALSEADEGYVTVTVDQVSIVSGAVQRVLYRRGHVGEVVFPDVFQIEADPSGQYLIASGHGAPYPPPGSSGSFVIAWLGTTQAVLRFRVLLWA
jgi:hypothetical protein